LSHRIRTAAAFVGYTVATVDVARLVVASAAIAVTASAERGNATAIHELYHLRVVLLGHRT